MTAYMGKLRYFQKRIDILGIEEYYSNYPQKWKSHIIKVIKMDGKTFYITKGKLKEIKKEYEDLVSLEHKKSLDQEAPKILESEDLNPEFVSFQEDVGFLRSRIDELKNIIDRHQLIKNPPKDQKGVIGLGAKVLISVDGQKDEFVIMGTLEANPALGKISNESPVGKALLGHKVGDAVVVSSPIKITYKIKNIKYEVS